MLKLLTKSHIFIIIYNVVESIMEHIILLRIIQSLKNHKCHTLYFWYALIIKLFNHSFLKPVGPPPEEDSSAWPGGTSTSISTVPQVPGDPGGRLVVIILGLPVVIMLGLGLPVVIMPGLLVVCMLGRPVVIMPGLLVVCMPGRPVVIMPGDLVVVIGRA